MPWTTRERGSGLVGNRRRTPCSFGGSLILFAYSGTVRNRRDLSANFSLSRGLPGILLSVVSYIFVRSILNAHIQEKLSSCQVCLFRNLRSCEIPNIEREIKRRNRLFFLTKKDRNGPLISVLLHRTVIAMVRINNRDSLAAESISPNDRGFIIARG